MQRIVLGFIAFCATLGAAIGIFLYVSAIPYIGIIGKFVAGLLIVGVLCGAWLLVVKTWTWTGIMHSERIRARNHERLIEAGEVSFYLQPLAPDFSIYHSSAEHNRALIAPGPQVTVREIPDNVETVLELYDTGATLRTIADSVGMTYYQVQKICTEHRGPAKSVKPKKSAKVPDSSVID